MSDEQLLIPVLVVKAEGGVDGLDMRLTLRNKRRSGLLMLPAYVVVTASQIKEGWKAVLDLTKQTERGYWLVFVAWTDSKPVLVRFGISKRIGDDLIKSLGEKYQARELEAPDE